MKDEPVFVYGKKKMKDESDFERTFGLAPVWCPNCGLGMKKGYFGWYCPHCGFPNDRVRMFGR